MPHIERYDCYGVKIEYLNKEGIIDQIAKRVFLEGHCHSLALAVNKLTGWDIYAVYDKIDLDNNPGHVVIKTNRNGYLDILGIGALKRWRKTWGPINIYPVNEKDIKKFIGYMKPEINKAMPFAKTLLRSLK